MVGGGAARVTGIACGSVARSTGAPPASATHPPTEFPGLSSLREILGSKKPQLFDGIAIRTACSAATFS